MMLLLFEVMDNEPPISVLWAMFVIVGLIGCFAGFSAGQMRPKEKQMFEVGQSLYTSGKLIEAEAQFSRVIRSYPRNGQAYFLRGEVRLLLKDFNGSYRDTNTYLRLAPKGARLEIAYNNRGAALRLKGSDVKALADFDKAISINPKYPPPHNGRGVILAATGRPNDALVAFERAIELDPKFLFPYVGRGAIRFERFDFEGALLDFKKVIDGGLTFSTNWVWRGIVYGSLGYWELAISDLRTAFQLESLPENRFTPRFDFTKLDSAIAKDTTNGNLYGVRGFINLFRKKDADAQRDFEAGFRNNPQLRTKIEPLIEHVKANRSN